MNIKIDGHDIKVKASDKSLIDVADRAKIAIPCACYRSGKKHGCCHACVVLVDGKRQYACTTAPKDGMSVSVNRKDLKELRRKRLTAYKDSLKGSRGKGACCSRGSTCCG